MKPTIKAEVDESGNIRPKEPVSLPPGSQLLITVLGGSGASETAVLSEASLAVDWNRPEEDAAWAGLESRPSRSRPLSLLGPILFEATAGACRRVCGRRGLGAVPDHQQSVR